MAAGASPETTSRWRSRKWNTNTRCSTGNSPAYASGGDAHGAAIPSIFSYYIQVEQLIYRESSGAGGPVQGLGAFASYSARFPSSPTPLTSVTEAYFGGVVYRGLLPQRGSDVTGIGAAVARLSQGGSKQETAIEVFYKAHLTPTMSIQPDVQYVVSPSGLYRDALVVGVRFQLAL